MVFFLLEYIFSDIVCALIRIGQLVRVCFCLLADCSLQRQTCCLKQMERKCIQPLLKTTKKACVFTFEHEHTHFSQFFSHSLVLSTFIQCGKSQLIGLWFSFSNCFLNNTESLPLPCFPSPSSQTLPILDCASFFPFSPVCCLTACVILFLLFVKRDLKGEKSVIKVQLLEEITGSGVVDSKIKLLKYTYLVLRRAWIGCSTRSVFNSAGWLQLGETLLCLDGVLNVWNQTWISVTLGKLYLHENLARGY